MPHRYRSRAVITAAHLTTENIERVAAEMGATIEDGALMLPKGRVLGTLREARPGDYILIQSWGGGDVAPFKLHKVIDARAFEAEYERID